MATLQEYKCPCCDGAIAFDSASQKMKCPYCGTEFEMETLASYDDELQNDTQSNMQWETNAGTEWQEGETDGLRTYQCNSCGCGQLCLVVSSAYQIRPTCTCRGNQWLC